MPAINGVHRVGDGVRFYDTVCWRECLNEYVSNQKYTELLKILYFTRFNQHNAKVCDLKKFITLRLIHALPLKFLIKSALFFP